MADEKTQETPPPGLAANEYIKDKSNYLRGTIVESLERQITGAIADDDTQLGKFHGFYQQDHRDVRAERAKKKLEPAYSFMIRIRMPAGVCTPEQWLKLDEIATTFANGTLRATTRQTFQYHGVIKNNLKRTMQAIDRASLDTIAACGDVNRNVMASSNPHLSAAHDAAYELARAISEHLLPKTGAWREIWIDGEKVAGGEAETEESEPVYGKTYLPRKFKTVVAVPPDNDVDIFAHDLGYIAVLDKKGAIAGWNVTVGGGMGMTHGDEATFPRTADVLGFCTTEQATDIAEKIVTVQRDWGDRTNRKHARLKYTIETRGLEAFRAELEKRLGYKLGKPRPFSFNSTGDRIGWVQDHQGLWHYTLFIESGRIKDTEERQILKGLREIAKVHDGEFRITANQNVIVARVKPENKAGIEALLAAHHIGPESYSGLRRNSMACVALPTCGLALAESERYLPDLVTELETALGEAGLDEADIVIRMTGCPNGCARPYLAEIGLVGRGPGTYNLYLGAAFDGSRLNKLYRRDIRHERIIAELRPLFLAYAKERGEKERFGDFVIRKGVIAKTEAGRHFHADLPELVG
ncbi:sulfite reductase (NADPH) hemoprotein beta-component [Arboricoccus pini]|uniref:Sulfite reductase [NADPH] hemoprotein beta-component n=1 Tax=Arboricoccus pini TaxID=1963835 RepID=A0A212R3T4_9PROT|nr:NADPH-dependent assimilatory sulfite reductase hemoprotein subunit [Arboricoccus pini]SNB66680.1 sulfite reductase (NADPH) hemoprotein beta-component [Arboricoccus pini]